MNRRVNRNAYISPRDKAVELHEEFMAEGMHPQHFMHKCAKNFALKLVNEIIEIKKRDYRFHDFLPYIKNQDYKMQPQHITYWLHVKDELEKL